MHTHIIYGDLIELAKAGKFDVIVHGCNCFNTMGAGIAKRIKEEFPEAYIEDRKTEYGALGKLGNISYAIVPVSNNELVVVNGYTQYNYKGHRPLVNYKALRKVFKNVKSLFHGRQIAYPKIGAGLAGGNWNVIQKIINEELQGEYHTLVLLP